jgi:hypothetical protein
LSGDHAQATISSFTWEAQQTSSEPKRGLSPAGRCSDLGNRRVQPATADRVRCVGATSFPKFHNCGGASGRAQTAPWTACGCLVRAWALVVVAIMCGVSCLSALELRIPRQVIKTGDCSVEVLLPQSGGCLELDASGWSRGHVDRCRWRPAISRLRRRGRGLRNFPAGPRPAVRCSGWRSLEPDLRGR